MSSEDRENRRFVPSSPYDVNDPPRFSQLVETAKDSFAYELKQFFNYRTSDANYKLSEIPSIQKFALNPTATNTTSSLETAVNLIMSNADTLNKFPMVSIVSSSIKERKMGIGNNLVSSIVKPPTIVGTKVGPFNLSSVNSTPLNIVIRTCPSGDLSNFVDSIITFSPLMFPDLTSVSVDQLIRVINRSMGLYYTLSKNSLGNLRISAGGLAAPISPNYIEVISGDSKALTALGFSIGDRASYLDLDNPPKNRYVVAGDMTINVDVIADDINVRTELADLVHNFFTFYLQNRRFELFGRSYFDQDQDPEEWYHIVLKNQFSWSAEVVKQRQGGEQYDMLYAVRGSVPIFIEDFINRDLVEDPVFAEQAVLSYSELLPVGDYFQGNYIKGI